MQKVTLNDLRRLFLDKWKWLLAGLAAGALLLSLYALLFVGNQYTAEISLYVQNVESDGVATSNNLTASRMLTNTYVVILQDERTLETVAQNMAEPVTVGQLKSALTIAPSTNTAMITVSATTNDPDVSRSMCQAMCTVAPGILYQVVRAGTVTPLGEVPPAVKTGPHIGRSALLGAIIGLLVMGAAAFIAYIADNTIKNKEDLQAATDLPLLGEIPTLDS